MKLRLILVLCAATVVLGCDVRATLYPVQGPLSKQSPAATYAATVKGFNGPGRTISVNYRDGEILTGNWEIVPGARASNPNTVPGDIHHSRQSAVDSVRAVAQNFGRAIQ